MSNYINSISDVIDNDLCIGCGLCSSIDKNLTVKLNRYGFYQATIQEVNGNPRSDSERASYVCPFTTKSKNENDIASSIFEKDSLFDEYIGTFKKIYAARSSTIKYFDKSSSGGALRSLVVYLLKKSVIKKVVYVKNKDTPPFFEYAITDKVDDIVNASTSAYAPVTLSDVVNQLHGDYSDYAFIGLPCFIKSLRNYFSIIKGLSANQHPIMLGMICGHLKSANYFIYLAHQMGISENDIVGVNFRKKIPGKSANEKGVSIKYSDGSSVLEKNEIVQNLHGTDYGFGYFKYKACDYCDDIFAETADITFGDAWLPSYMDKGTSLVVLRSTKLLQYFNQMIDEKLLKVEHLETIDAIKSQFSGIKHRRKGLQYRLFLDKIKNRKAPQKRVLPSNNTISYKYKIVQKFRIWIRLCSSTLFFECKKKNDLKSFTFKTLYVWKIYTAFRGKTIYFIPRIFIISVCSIFKFFVSKF